MRKAIAAAALAASFALGLSLNVFTYGGGAALNGGVVVSVKQLPVCVGLEVYGHPGFFGGSYSDCDF